MAINTQMDHQVMLAPHNDFSAPQGDSSAPHDAYFSAPHDAHFFAPHGIDLPVVETHQSRNRHAREESRDLPLRPLPPVLHFFALMTPLKGSIAYSLGWTTLQTRGTYRPSAQPRTSLIRICLHPPPNRQLTTLAM
jgi:hypothetical protein